MKVKHCSDSRVGRAVNYIFCCCCNSHKVKLASISGWIIILIEILLEFPTKYSSSEHLMCISLFLYGPSGHEIYSMALARVAT